MSPLKTTATTKQKQCNTDHLRISVGKDVGLVWFLFCFVSIRKQSHQKGTLAEETTDQCQRACLSGSGCDPMKVKAGE